MRIVLVFGVSRVVADPFDRVDGFLGFACVLAGDSLREDRGEEFLCAAVAAPDVAELWDEELHCWTEKGVANS